MAQRRAIWVFLALGAGVALSYAELPALLIVVTLAVITVGCLTTPLVPFAVMLLISPLRALILTESPDALPFDVGQMLFVSFVISWFLHLLIHKRSLRGVLRRSPVLAAVGLFLIGAGGSAFAAISLHAWMTEWLKWFQIAGITIIVVDIVRTESAAWLAFAVVAAALANAGVGIYEYFGGSGALHLLINEQNFRAFGTFGQPNPFGGFMGMAAPIAIAMTGFSAYRLWQRRAFHDELVWRTAAVAFYCLAAATITFALFASWSRGAWLAFAVSLSVAAIALPHRLTRAGIMLVLGLTVLGFISAGGFLPTSIMARISSVTNEFSAASDVRGVDVTPENYANLERLAHWQAAVSMATVNPWLGIGFGNYEIAYLDYSLLFWDMPLGHAHNYYLNVLGETGMIGAITYVIMFCTVAICAWRLRRHPDSAFRLIGIGTLCSWVYLAVHSLTDNLYVNALFLHIGTIIALVAVLYDDLFARRKWLRNA